jgi:uncharacterized membrane protein
MQPGIERNAGRVWSIAILASALVLVASVFGPRPAFATLCHQMPGRSFVVDGHLFAVCHRCTGIYTGIVGGLLLTAFPAVRSFFSRYGLILVGGALALVLFDFGLDFLGLVGNSPISRVLTGTILGTSAGAFLGKVILGYPRRTSPQYPVLNTQHATSPRAHSDAPST